MFSKDKVKKKMIKAYCTDMLSYIESRRKNSRISKGEKETLEYFFDVIEGLLERVK